MSYRWTNGRTDPFEKNKARVNEHLDRMEIPELKSWAIESMENKFLTVWQFDKVVKNFIQGSHSKSRAIYSTINKKLTLSQA